MRIHFFSFFSLLILATSINAQGLTSLPRDEIVSAYRRYGIVTVPTIPVPTVVEIPFSQQLFDPDQFAVYDQTTQTFEPSFVRQETVMNEPFPLSVSADAMGGMSAFMVDGSTLTHTEFVLPDTAQGSTQIRVTTPAPVAYSGFTFVLDEHVALPTMIGIRAVVDGTARIVVADRSMDQLTVRFPRTVSDQWIISISFAQPLRIAELRPVADIIVHTRISHLRFLARPNRTYRVYFDPDRAAHPPVGEAGNLALHENVLVLPLLEDQANPLYRMADVDGDTIADTRDNCVHTKNRDQVDVDRNGRGDACDDFDRDGHINSSDNCPDATNRSQTDMDGDGIGDACDGEESRITERLTWLPWVGIGAAMLVVITLLIITARMPKDK